MTEQIRGCGYRKVGALYLCGEYTPVACDRLPYPLDVCPTCGGGIKVSRGFTKIIPLNLFGYHLGCKDLHRCVMCYPNDEVAFIMGVGEKFYKTPGDFVQEAMAMGISKRIPFIPTGMVLGQTLVYLAHPKACEVREPVAVQQAMLILEESKTRQPRLLDSERIEKHLGIFCTFRTQRVEKLVWESEATPEEMEKLKQRGITPVIVEDGDPDRQLPTAKAVGLRE